MANKVDICNAALSMLGEAANIVSVKPSDGSEMAGLCARWLPMAVRRIFEEHDWSFAQKRAKLSELAGVDATVYGASHCYAFPSDAVRIIDLYELLPDAKVEKVDHIPIEGSPGLSLLGVAPSQWRIEFNSQNSARVIVTNVENAVARYTAYLSSPALWPQYFIEPLTILLASYLTGALKRQSSTSEEAINLIKQYRSSLSAAKTIDASGTRQKASRVPSSISSRWV